VAAAPLPEHRRRQEGEVTGGPGPPLGVEGAGQREPLGHGQSELERWTLHTLVPLFVGHLAGHEGQEIDQVTPPRRLSSQRRVDRGMQDNTHHTAPQRRRRLPVQPPPSHPQVQGWIEHLRAFANSRNE
jgi:hypothetical protein